MTDLDTIYREYHTKVMNYLRHKVNNPDVAEDLCSEVFVKITAGIENYDEGKSALSTWIYNITRNTLYDYFRTRRDFAELDETVPTDDDTEEKLCTNEMLETLADALEAIPERERELIIRHYYYGETLKEIAAKLKISYIYAKVLHKSALDKIKKYF